MLSGDDIKKVLFYRPYLMIDKVLEREPGQSATGLKRITYNEPLNIDGSLPESLLLEASLQLEALLHVTEEELDSSSLNYYGYLTSLNNVSFYRKIYVGDTLIVKVKVLKNYSNIVKIRTEGRTKHDLIFEGSLSNFIGKL